MHDCAKTVLIKTCLTLFLRTPSPRQPSAKTSSPERETESARAKALARARAYASQIDEVIFWTRRPRHATHATLARVHISKSVHIIMINDWGDALLGVCLSQNMPEVRGRKCIKQCIGNKCERAACACAVFSADHIEIVLLLNFRN